MWLMECHPVFGRTEGIESALKEHLPAFLSLSGGNLPYGLTVDGCAEDMIARMRAYPRQIFLSEVLGPLHCVALAGLIARDPVMAVRMATWGCQTLKPKQFFIEGTYFNLMTRALPGLSSCELIDHVSRVDLERVSSNPYSVGVAAFEELRRRLFPPEGQVCDPADRFKLLTTLPLLGERLREELLGTRDLRQQEATVRRLMLRPRPEQQRHVAGGQIRPD